MIFHQPFIGAEVSENGKLTTKIRTRQSKNKEVSGFNAVMDEKNPVEKYSKLTGKRYFY